MKKIIHITLLFFFAFLAFSAQAQNPVMSDYWKDFDFSDTTLISSNTMSDKLIKFFYSFTDGDERRFDSLSISGLDFVLDKAKVNMQMYEYILGFALKGYSAMGRDQVTDYLLNYPQLVRIIVVFWSTDCEYCHDFLVQIRKHLDLESDFELVTFALAENREEVTKAVKKMRLPGYHFYDALRWDSKAFLSYHITSTPTVFVLNEDKYIVCKPYDWQELRDWLKKE